MLKRFLWAKNFVFLTLFALLSAQVANRVIVSNIPETTEKEGPTASTGRSGRKPGENKPLNLYKVVSSRNIFNSEYAGEDEGGTRVSRSKSSEPLKKADLNVVLIGTVVSTPEDSFAIIEDKKKRKQELYQIDDMIENEARVLKIDRCRVVVLREGMEEIIECPDEESPDRPVTARTAAVRSRPSTNTSDTIRKVSDSEYMIDESEVEKALANINQLITQIRVVPNFQDGKANGFKVFAIKPKSIFSKIGLKNGDVIQRVNDTDITSPDKAFSAFQELKNEKSLNVEILRRGSSKSLQYEIR